MVALAFSGEGSHGDAWARDYQGDSEVGKRETGEGKEKALSQIFLRRP
jgi:hypothetical protein